MRGFVRCSRNSYFISKLRAFKFSEEAIQAAAGAKGKVVHWNSTARILKYIQTQQTGVETTGSDKNKLTAFAAAEVVTGSPSTSTGTIASLTNPEIAYYSGNAIYAEDRSPITRATDQTENIKLIVEF